MMKVDFFLHEITNFLRTATIKNSYLAEQVKQRTMLRLQVTELDDEDNPFYINIIGEYSQFDEVMTVASLDDESIIDFTKANLELHPKTKFAYSVGNKFYNDLETRYPHQRDLIKSIRYPVADIPTAINAENFQLLAYDGSQLEEYELSSIINAIQDHLRMIRSRWYIKEYEYEELYSLEFWSSLWASLPNVILNQRIDNLHTASVHSKYIWEYLTSKGLGDYRSILTREQQLFLYRNINYLIRNRGKDGTLSILSDNLLDYHNVSLNAKEIILNSENMLETAEPVAEVISRNIKDDITPSEVAEYGYETVEEIFIREHENGLEPILSDQHIADAENVLSNINTTWLPTKLLELNKIDLNDEFLSLYVNFALETLFYKQSRNEVRYNISVGLDTSINFSIQDVIALINYAGHRCFKQRVTLNEQIIDQFVGEDVILNRETITVTESNKMSLVGETIATTRPKYIPQQVNLSIPFKNSLVMDDMDLKFELDNNEYNVSQIFDMVALLDAIPTNVGNIANANDMLGLIDDQFKIIIKMWNYVRSSNDDFIHTAFDHLRANLFVIEDTTLDLGLTYDTYEEWFDSNSALRNVVDSLEYAIDPEEAYSNFADELLLQIIPFNNSTAVKFSNFTSDNFRLMKQLFIQLCSYNITFLDTQLSTKTYINFTPVVLRKDRYSDIRRQMLVDMDDMQLHVIDKVDRKITYDVHDGFEHHLTEINEVIEIDEVIEADYSRHVYGLVNINDGIDLITGSTVAHFGGRYDISGHARYHSIDHQTRDLGFVNHDGHSIGTDFDGLHYIDFTQGGDLTSSGYVIEDTDFLAGPRVAAIIASEYNVKHALSIDSIDDIISNLDVDLEITMTYHDFTADIPSGMLAAYVPAYRHTVSVTSHDGVDVVTTVTNLVTDNPATEHISLVPLDGDPSNAPQFNHNSFKFVNSDDRQELVSVLNSNIPLPDTSTMVVSVLVTGTAQSAYTSIISFDDPFSHVSDGDQINSWQLGQSGGKWQLFINDNNSLRNRITGTPIVRDPTVLTAELTPTSIAIFINGDKIAEKVGIDIAFDSSIHGLVRNMFSVGTNRNDDRRINMDFYGLAIYEDPAKREEIESWLWESTNIEQSYRGYNDSVNVRDGLVASRLPELVGPLEVAYEPGDIISKLSSFEPKILDDLHYSDEVISKLPDEIPPLEINYNAADLNGNVLDLDPDDPDYPVEHDVISVLPCVEVHYYYGPLSSSPDDSLFFEDGTPANAESNGWWVPW